MNDLDEQIRRLHGQGLGRNAIARELDVSARKVTETARRLGLSFDRTSTKHATEARTADSQARRADLAAKVLDLIEGETVALAALGPPGNTLDADRRGRTVASIARALSDTVRNVPIEAGDATAEIGALGELFQLAAAEIRRQDHPVPPTAGANPGA